MDLTVQQIRTMFEKTRGYNKRMEIVVNEEDDVEGNTVVIISVYNVEYMIAADGSWDCFRAATQTLINSGGPYDPLEAFKKD